MTVQQTAGTQLDDRPAAIARPLFYSVFALEPGRPYSRPAPASISLLPTVRDLTADVGPASVVLRWSAHPSAQRVEVFQVAAGTRTPLPVDRSTCTLKSLEEGVGLHFLVIAVYRSRDGAELRADPVMIDATPRSHARPVTQLQARPVMREGVPGVQISWREVDRSDVQIIRSTRPAPWRLGERVSPEQVHRFGVEVSGVRTAARGEVLLDAQFPPGVHHVLAVSSGGTGLVAGECAVVAVTAPVTGLQATEFADHATLAWQWPETSQLAEVSWESDGEPEVEVVGRTQYGVQGGFRVPLGPAPTTVQVRSLVQVEGRRFAAPALNITLRAVVEVQIMYEVKRARSLQGVRGRAKHITFRSDENCSGVQVQVVVSPGSVMPLNAEKCIPLVSHQLDLTAGIPVTLQVFVPTGVHKPFWVRASSSPGGAV